MLSVKPIYIINLPYFVWGSGIFKKSEIIYTEQQKKRCDFKSST